MHRLVTIALLLSTGIITAAVAAADEKPKVVCESDASGANMVCRDVWLGEDAAPFRRVAPASPAPAGAAPKPSLPILAPPSAHEPSASQAPAYLRKSDALPGVEPALPATSAPAIAERSTSSTPVEPTAVALEPATKPLPPATASSDTTVRTVAKALPASVADVLVAAEPIVSPRPERPAAPAREPTAAASQPSPDAVAQPPVTTLPTSTTPVEPAPLAALAPAAFVALRDSVDFRGLDGTHYTLELANAKSPDSLRALAARLQLPGAVYLVHLRSPESDRWLLTWADHASQSEARSAREQVPADTAINSGWPRRIAPLQNELVSP